MNFDEEGAPAVFDEFGFGEGLRNFDAAFRVDVNFVEAIFVENVLGFTRCFGGIGLLGRFFERLFIGLRERHAEIIKCFDEAFDLRGKRLQFDLRHNRSRAGSGEERENKNETESKSFGKFDTLPLT